MTDGPTAGFRSAYCIVLVAALVAGCSGGQRAQPDVQPTTPGAASSIPTFSVNPPSPTSRLSDDLPTPGRIDQQDATAVSKWALIVMYTVDSTVDTGLRDAKLRAERYFTHDYAVKVRAEPKQYVHGEWQQHRAYLAVQLKPLVLESGAPSDGPTAAYRQWEMTTTPTGRDDWRGTASKSVVFTVLARSSKSAPWRISNVLVRSQG